MTKFESRFLRVLGEQDMDRKAMEMSLDQDTNPSDFDVSANAQQGVDSEVSQHTAAAAEATARRHNEYVDQIKGWSSRLQEFNEFLNGTQGSVQSIIAAAASEDPKTILADLQSEQSRITRAATELAALVQKFNSALSTEKDPSYRGV